MKLYYDRKSTNPTYFGQVGIRNGKKVTTKNLLRIGKHSELLKITKDPKAYALKQIEEYNKQIKEEKVECNLTINFSEKLINKGDVTSESLC